LDLFEGKSAIVTGGASGIGRALGEELGRRGAHVILADVNEALLEETVSSLAERGYKARGTVLDVTDFVAVRKLVEDTASEHRRLDYIFNNAGIGVLGEAQDKSIEDWHNVIDTNLYGVVHGVAAAYPLMVKQGSGHIVNTSSLAGLMPATGEISYTTSKYGVVGLSNALRVEGKIYGVKVSVVCPGFIRTPIYGSIKLLSLDREKVMKGVPKGIGAEECAGIILRGVENNKATIVITALAKSIWAMQRISPGLVRALISRELIRRIRAGKSPGP
jgi:NAD(P)-dependent dehydrogenase (short-subunit alcohol dehydrogenase family)